MNKPTRFQAAFAAFLLILLGVYGTHSGLHVGVRQAKATDTALSAVIAGGLYNATTSTGGFLSAADKTTLNGLPASISQSVIVVSAATTSSLPAYTKAGTGIGATLTANAVGAFPKVDGVTLTAGTPGAGSNRILLQNGAAFADNGLWDLTTQGSGGSDWVLTRSTVADEATEIAGSKIRVKAGFQSGGAEYEYRAIAAITVDTTPQFWWRTDQGIGANEGIDWSDDFQEVVVAAANTNAGPGMLSRATNGTSAAWSVANGTTFNTSATIGALTGGTGSLASGFVALSDAWTASNTAPDGAGSFIIPSPDSVSFDIEARFTVPTLSTSSQEYNLQFGLMKQRANSQTSSADGCYFQYYRPTSVDFEAICATGGTGVGSPIDTGVAVVAGTYNRLQEVHYAGDPNIYFLVDGVLDATISANVPTAQLLGFALAQFKTAGITTASTMTVDNVHKHVRFHTRRAA